MKIRSESAQETEGEKLEDGDSSPCEVETPECSMKGTALPAAGFGVLRASLALCPFGREQ